MKHGLVGYKFAGQRWRRHIATS